MRALFSAVEILGDLVNITPSIYKWKELHPGYTVELRVQDQPFCHILEGLPGITVRFMDCPNWDDIKNPPDRGEYDFFHCFSVAEASKYFFSHNKHISEGHAYLLGVKIDHPIPVLPKIERKAPKSAFIAIIPFCGSVFSSHVPKYELLVDIAKYIISRLGIEVHFFGPEQSPWAELEEVQKELSEQFKGKIVNRIMPANKIKDTLAYIMGASAIVCPDNGILHCISALSWQAGYKIPTLALLKRQIPINVAYPYGISKDCLVVKHDYLYWLTLPDIRVELETFLNKVRV